MQLSKLINSIIIIACSYMQYARVPHVRVQIADSTCAQQHLLSYHMQKAEKLICQCVRISDEPIVLLDLLLTIYPA